MKDRLARRHHPSRRECLLVFTLCFTLIYSWSILMLFNELPAWLLYMRGWSIAGMFAYGQVFALFESLLVFGILFAASAILPARLLRDHFVAQGSIMLLLAAAGAIAMHVTKEAPLWPSKKLILGILLYLAAVVVSAWLLHRFPRWASKIESGVGRLVALLYLYLPFVALSGIIIVIRNIAG